MVLRQNSNMARNANGFEFERKLSRQSRRSRNSVGGASNNGSHQGMGGGMTTTTADVSTLKVMSLIILGARSLGNERAYCANGYEFERKLSRQSRRSRNSVGGASNNGSHQGMGGGRTTTTAEVSTLTVMSLILLGARSLGNKRAHCANGYEFERKLSRQSRRSRPTR
jgi:hypothetical protein